MVLSLNTEKKIKLQALYFIRKYSLSVPIDVYYLADKLNIYIKEVDKADLPGIEGLTFPICNNKYPKKTIMIINKDARETRKRFTIAHEIYHAIEHKNIRLFSNNNNIERTANIFARELLMPANLIKSAIYGKEIKNIAALGYWFNVSKQAMEIRIKELNLKII